MAPDLMAQAAEEMKKALKEADPAATEIADGEKEDPAAVDPASDSDIVTDPAAVKEPEPVPYPRFKEVNDQKTAAETRTAEVEAENRRLMQDLADIARRVGKDEKVTPAEKVETKENIETLVTAGEMTREEADKFLRVLNAAGVSRGSSEMEALKKTIEDQNRKLQTIEKSVFGDKDAQEQTKALAKYDGIVTAETLQAKLREMVKSGDPDRVHMANHSSYEKIIQAEFFKEILKAETDKVLAGKKPPAPKIQTGGKGKGELPKKPAVEEVEYNPSNPQAFDADLRAAVKRELNKAAE